MHPRFVLWLMATCVLAACSDVTPAVPPPEIPEYSSVEEAVQAIHELSQAPQPLPPTRPVLPQIVNSNPAAGKRIALTFDACPSKAAVPYDARIIKTLEDTKTPATLFISGSWAVREPSRVKMLAANPLFEIGNHTFTHPHLTRLSDERVTDELLRTQRVLRDLTGRAPELLRPPYGEVDSRVATLAAQAGLTTIQFDLPAGDSGKGATKERLTDWVLRKARPGSIVVLHMNHPLFRTGEALPGIIQGLKQKGYELTTVSTLLGNEPPQVCAPGLVEKPLPPKLAKKPRVGQGKSPLQMVVNTPP